MLHSAVNLTIDGCVQEVQREARERGEVLDREAAFSKAHTLLASRMADVRNRAIQLLRDRGTLPLPTSAPMPKNSATIEKRLSAVEDRLTALEEALRDRDDDEPEDPADEDEPEEEIEATDDDGGGDGGDDDGAEMTISAEKRKTLAADKFALPAQRKYPIDTAARVRSATARLEEEHDAGKVSDRDYKTARTAIAKAAKRFGINSKYAAPNAPTTADATECRDVFVPLGMSTMQAAEAAARGQLPIRTTTPDDRGNRARALMAAGEAASWDEAIAKAHSESSPVPGYVMAPSSRPRTIPTRRQVNQSKAGAR